VEGVDWPLCVPPNRGERSTPVKMAKKDDGRRHNLARGAKPLDMAPRMSLKFRSK